MVRVWWEATEHLHGEYKVRSVLLVLGLHVDILMA